MSQRAVARLAKKLDEAAENNMSIEIGEEMRHLTLQVQYERGGVRPAAPVVCARGSLLGKAEEVNAAECRGLLFIAVVVCV